jgi:hypothetical protein
MEPRTGIVRARAAQAPINRADPGRRRTLTTGSFTLSSCPLVFTMTSQGSNVKGNPTLDVLRRGERGNCLSASGPRYPARRSCSIRESIFRVAGPPHAFRLRLSISARPGPASDLKGAVADRPPAPTSPVPGAGPTNEFLAAINIVSDNDRLPTGARLRCIHARPPAWPR